MAYDRFVHFKKGQVPSKQVVQYLLEDYLGDFLIKNEWGGGRWTATLVGHTSWPFRRIAEFQGTARSAHWTSEESKQEERWLEVFIAKDNIDVITRQTDEVTNIIADGFARLLARAWNGRLEEE